MSAKDVCEMIGCSGVSKELCEDAPEKCDIVRKFIKHTAATTTKENNSNE